MEKNIDLKMGLHDINIKKFELAKELGVSTCQFSNMINLVEIVDYEKERILAVARQIEKRKKLGG